MNRAPAPARTATTATAITSEEELPRGSTSGRTGGWWKDQPRRGPVRSAPDLGKHRPGDLRRVVVRSLECDGVSGCYARISVERWFRAGNG